jgi:anaerobic selenocysteine-containing dehydrogenase
MFAMIAVSDMRFGEAGLLDDRYRGVFGQRRVVFIHPADIAMLGFKNGDWVDMTTVWDDGVERRANYFRLVEYDIPRGCIDAYYPETNPLVPLSSVGDVCNTPTSKSIPVLLHRSSEPATVPAF